MMRFKKQLYALALLALLSIGTALPSLAAQRCRSYHNNRYYGYSRAYGRSYQPSYWQRHPYVKKAAIGGGAGAVVGGLLAPEGFRADGAVKGGLAGAAIGAGYEYLRRDSRRW